MKEYWEAQMVRIKTGWENSGKLGVALGEPVTIYRNSQEWLPVIWQGEEDPDWHKLAGIEKVPILKGVPQL